VPKNQSKAKQEWGKKKRERERGCSNSTKRFPNPYLIERGRADLFFFFLLFSLFFFLVWKKGIFLPVQPTYLRTARASTLPFPFSASIFFIIFFFLIPCPLGFAGALAFFFPLFSISSNYLFGTPCSIACSEKEDWRAERKREGGKKRSRERKGWEGRSNQYREQALLNSGCGVWIILYGTHTDRERERKR